ncbi:glycoside hydrolase family 28 protein [Thermoanaerobacter siderophilus]|uniref:Endopolygalacturonase n=1 Tax=Thermoanaerobacter siderophilus SR4 TaxID=880478 RepID=I9KRN3_9THEO|nr:glycoside hydrolase family 28 protein [Thermoanaerobacter siderophilus]EIV99558.1 endopolygalacturonase [Thermoanaerobacter siderophilus SR4]
MLKLNTVAVTSRTASLEIENDECYYVPNKMYVYVNDTKKYEVNTNVFTIKNLIPDTEYLIMVEDSVTLEKSDKVMIKTLEEKFMVNVRDFGAKGDGKTIDTSFIQAAIYSCPEGGRVFFPGGIYLTGPIFLKSNITLELSKDAVLLGANDRNLYPILPNTIKSQNSDEELYLATWEGEAAECFASLITGINIENVNIIGEGTIDGNANFETWWKEHKIKKGAWRPRTVFLNQCKNILIEGVTIKNSPAWTIHPFQSENLKFINLTIENPKNSPNTDGLNPEASKNVLILGCKFSVGDDCIAIKAGKFDMAQKLGKLTEKVFVRNCYMEYGHGGVVIGSEMSGGVKEVYVEKCIFNNTDRGIRIKTRRGRGGFIDEIHADKIRMNRVKTPFTINSFYFCDVDGKTEYVWSKEKLPIDERTPYIGNIYLKNINCTDTQVAAGFIYGLPERKIEKVIMEEIYVDFDQNAKADYPEMLSFVEPMCKNGFYFNNVKYLKLKNVKVEKAETEPFIKLNIDEEEIL